MTGSWGGFFLYRFGSPSLAVAVLLVSVAVYIPLHLRVIGSVLAEEGLDLEERSEMRWRLFLFGPVVVVALAWRCWATR